MHQLVSPIYKIDDETVRWIGKVIVVGLAAQAMNQLIKDYNVMRAEISTAWAQNEEYVKMKQAIKILRLRLKECTGWSCPLYRPKKVYNTGPPASRPRRSDPVDEENMGRNPTVGNHGRVSRG
ncbi:hypothetical protein HK102_003639 [Quaeritorhiza haematococci]|nr:hypothetical protein HK102_003639 [Quaeritorhiza haematococci]